MLVLRIKLSTRPWLGGACDFQSRVRVTEFAVAVFALGKKRNSKMPANLKSMFHCIQATPFF